MEISRIIVGIDFTAESESAARYAVKIARQTGADIVLVHVGLAQELAAQQLRDGAALEWQHIVEVQNAEDRERLEALRELFAAEVPEVSHALVHGFTDSALCDTARELGADLVIIGTHGRTGLKRLIMGSVAERVVRICERNVMVARPGAESDGGFARILVPTDFSVHSEAALELALSLIAPGGRIDLLHAWNLPAEGSRAWSSALLDELEREGRAAGRKLLERHHRDGVSIDFVIERGRAVPRILDRLRDGRYELVAMGSHGRRGLRRFLLGSVAELTVRHAPCSVLVAHGT